MQCGCVPEIGEENEVCETPPVKTTDLQSKRCNLCKYVIILYIEYNDIFEGIDKLKCVQVKLHIDDTVQDRQRIISDSCRALVT